MAKDGTPGGGGPVRDEAELVREAAREYAVPVEALHGLIAAARDDARHRRRRVLAADLERRVDGIVASRPASGRKGGPP